MVFETVESVMTSVCIGMSVVAMVIVPVPIVVSPDKVTCMTVVSEVGGETESPGTFFPIFFGSRVGVGAVWRPLLTPQSNLLLAAESTATDHKNPRLIDRGFL
jgi:hypothetical protein